MARYIKITKIKSSTNSLDHLHYYNIHDDSEPEDLYMCIDAKNQIIEFYSSDDFTVPVGRIDPINFEENIDFSVNKRLLWPAYGKARQALLNNEFPQYLDYCA